MDLYFNLFEVLFPVFFVVGIGYYLGKKNPRFNTDFITTFASKIGSPGLIFYSLTSTGVTFAIITDYFVYAIFNWLSPITTLIYAALMLKIKMISIHKF